MKVCEIRQTNLVGPIKTEMYHDMHVDIHIGNLLKQIRIYTTKETAPIIISEFDDMYIINNEMRIASKNYIFNITI